MKTQNNPSLRAVGTGLQCLVVFPTHYIPLCKYVCSLQRCGMPKEQGHFGERVGRSTSKNAKDRSNSATVRADRGHRAQAGPGHLGGMGDMGEQLSRFDSGKDSEKDSGYSGEPVLLPGDVFVFVLLWSLLFVAKNVTPSYHLHTQTRTHLRTKHYLFK